MEPTGDPTRSLTHTTYQLSVFLPKEEEEGFLSHLPGCKAARWNPYFTDIVPADGGQAGGPAKDPGTLGHPSGGIHGLRRRAAMTLICCAMPGWALPGNASDDVKLAADYVTADVDDDGVRRALEHYGVI